MVRSFFIWFLVVFLQAPVCVYAQNVDLDPEKWAIELSKKDYRVNEAIRKLDSTLEHADSTKTMHFLNALTQKRKRANYYFEARFDCLKARILYFKNVYGLLYQDQKAANKNRLKAQITELFSSAMDLAYRSEDDYLIAFVSYAYSSTIIFFDEVGTAVMYAKSSIDLDEKLSNPVLPIHYQFLAELLYKVQEYDECVRYGKKGVAAWLKSPIEDKGLTVNCMNTVALGYHRQKKYDSAFLFYNQALQLARQTNNNVWVGIVSGNLAQILYAQGKYDTAFGLFKMDYNTSKVAGYFDNAGNSLQWAARTDLALGRKAAALAEAREAFQLLKRWPDAGYLRNAYYTAMQIFRELGEYDSAFYYNNLWSALNDSLDKVVAISSLAITKARLNDEVNRYKMQALSRERRSEVLYRNLIITAIVALALLALLLVNRRRLQEKLKTQKAEQEQRRMEQEVASAKEQLRLFTENIVEKTALIEKLEGQAHAKEISFEQQAIISELSHQTILTEEDWGRFRMVFETIHPQFFSRLREQAPDVTLAEQRMTALMRLQLQPRQMATLLGISTNSVYKAKQRLRQRFNLETDGQVEAFLSHL